MKKEKNLLEDKPGKLFVAFLVPSMVSMIAVALYSFVDTFVVAQDVGDVAVAAMGVCTPVLCLYFALGYLFGVGGGVLFTIAREKGDLVKQKQIFTVAVASTIIVGLISAIFGNIFIKEIAYFLGATEKTISHSVEYLRWVFSCSAVITMDVVLTSFVRNDEKPKVAMAATTIATVLNIILDFMFVISFGWGMGGAAFATCIGSTTSTIISVVYICAKSKQLKLVKVKFKTSLIYFGNIVKVGLSSFILEASTSIITFAFVNFAGSLYGNSGISAFTAIITINLVVYAIFNGVAQAVQPMLSANYGAAKADRLKKFLYYDLITALAIGIVFCVICRIFPENLAALLLSSDKHTRPIAVEGIKYQGFGFIFMALGIVLGGYFQSIMKPVKSLVVFMCRSVVLPVAFAFILIKIMPSVGLFWAIPLGEAASLLVAVILMFVGK